MIVPLPAHVTRARLRRQLERLALVSTATAEQARALADAADRVLEIRASGCAAGRPPADSVSSLTRRLAGDCGPALFEGE